MKIIIFALIMLIFFSCMGCVATLVHDKEAVSVCKTEEANGWSGKYLNYGLKLDNIDYSFVQMDTELGIDKKVDGYIKVHWVYFYGHTRGNAVGWPAPPMLYSPDEAILNINGKRIKALNRVWKDGGVKKYGIYFPEEEVKVPVNLNELTHISGGYFIAFPIKSVKPKDVYTITAGRISLDGKYYPLPIESSCYHPSQWRWAPIH